MPKDLDDAIARLVESAEGEIHKTREREHELDTQERVTLESVSRLLRIREETSVRPFVTKTFVMVFVFLVVCSMAAAIYGGTISASQGDGLVDRVLKVNQSIVPTITLVIGFYFGASRP